MKKSLLIIQFRENKNTILSEQRSFLRVFKKFGIKADFVSIFDDSILWDNPLAIIRGYAGVVLGGSGDFDFDGGRNSRDPKKEISYQILNKIKPLLRHIFGNNFPLLGGCYGHQIIGAYRGVEIVNNKEQSKIGSFEVLISPNHQSDALLKRIPANFTAQYGHKDSLNSLPENSEVIASGKNCSYSIIKYSPIIYGIQFHPELTADDVAERLKNSPGYLPEKTNVESLIRASLDSELILNNFAYIAFSE